MKSIITGINGFIGFHLSNLLIQKGDQVVGIDKERKQVKKGSMPIYYGNLLDQKFLKKTLDTEKPDRIFHLAAQSNIPYSFSNPQETMEVNIIGTLNLLEATKKLNQKVSFVSFGSSAEYGKSARSGKATPETANLEPTNPYGVSKVAQGQLVEIYRQAYKLNLFHIRPFAIIGPGKLGDAVSDFARGIVAIERGEKKELLVGNVSHVRDFLDVRDAVGAIELVSRSDNDYSIYNICSGKGWKLEDLLTKLINMSTKKVILRTDREKSRPTDDAILVGNPERLFSLGFKPKIAIEQTLSDILDYWRETD